MSFKVEELGKSMVKLTIEVAAEEFGKAMETAYQKNKNKFSVQGFRKGKAPKAMIEKMYGAGVFYEDAANELIPDAYEKAAVESGLDIVSRPEIDLVQVEKGKALADSASTYLEEAETRLAEFTPFLTYYMNWSSVQKPLLLAGEDKSSACLSVISNGKIYVCNTDEITIEDILDLVSKKDDLTGDIIDTGIVVDAATTPELITNIFYNKAPLHDGAVIIRDGRIDSAGCVLPMTSRVDIPKDLGTRHRASIGTTEITDAVVVIVSEETGIISISINGELERGFTYTTLRTRLEEILNPIKDSNSKKKKKTKNQTWSSPWDMGW